MSSFVIKSVSLNSFYKYMYNFKNRWLVIFEAFFASGTTINKQISSCTESTAGLLVTLTEKHIFSLA